MIAVRLPQATRTGLIARSAPGFALRDGRRAHDHIGDLDQPAYVWLPGVPHVISNGQPVATALVYIFPLYQALGLLALVVALVLLTVLMRRRRNSLIQREAARRTNEKTQA